MLEFSISILQMKKWKHEEVMYLAKGHKTSRWRIRIKYTVRMSLKPCTQKLHDLLSFNFSYVHLHFSFVFDFLQTVSVSFAYA